MARAITASPSSNGDTTIDYAPPALLPVARRFLSLDAPAETFTKRLIFLIAALLITAAHFYWLHSFWAPGHIGNNQNAYLVAGRMMATQGRVSLEPQSPYEFVGWMWNTVGGNEPKSPGGGPYYPKYPIGLPLLNALAFKLGGAAHGVELAYLVSPICASLAVFAVFMFTRQLAGSFAATLAMILYGTLTVPVMQANNPYSHAPAVAFVTWGMYFLLTWWQFGGAWRGILAGFLLGYAATIRYTEGLFVIPLAVAVGLAFRFRWPERRRLLPPTILTVLAIVSFVLGGVFGLSLSGFGFAAHAKLDRLSASPFFASAIVVVGAVLTLLCQRLSAVARDGWAIAEYAITVALFAGVIAVPSEWFGIGATDVGASALIRIGLLALIWLVALTPWRQSRGLTSDLVPILAWAVPIGLLFWFNWLTFGSFTGYDSTRESSAFKWEDFGEKWQYTVAQLNGTGLYLLFPLSVLGMCLALRWNWRVAVVLFAWFIPSTLLYTAYYWGQSLPLWGFLRFFATVLPAGVIAAAWLIERTIRSDPSTPRISRILAPIAAGIFVAAPVSVNAFEVLDPLERDHVMAYNLADVGVHVKRQTPPNSVVFGQSQFLLNYLQASGDHTFYGSDYFAEGRPVPRMGFGNGNDDSDPNPIQPERKRFVDKVYGNSTPRERMEKGAQIMLDALAAGKKVYMVHGAIGAAGLYKKIQNDARFTLIVRDAWTEPWRMSEKAAKTLGALSAFGVAKREPWRWQIIEITVNTSAPASTQLTTTQPTTNPSQ